MNAENSGAKQSKRHVGRYRCVAPSVIARGGGPGVSDDPKSHHNHQKGNKLARDGSEDKQKDYSSETAYKGEENAKDSGIFAILYVNGSRDQTTTIPNDMASAALK